MEYHYTDVIMGAMASQITSLTIVYSAVYSGAHQRKHQSLASLALVKGIHRGPVNSPHKWPVTWKMSPFDDVIMCCYSYAYDTACRNGIRVRFVFLILVDFTHIPQGWFIGIGAIVPALVDMGKDSGLVQDCSNSNANAMDWVTVVLH